MMLLVIATGAEVPHSALPIWLDRIGLFCPLTNAIDAAPDPVLDDDVPT